MHKAIDNQETYIDTINSAKNVLKGKHAYDYFSHVSRAKTSPDEMTMLIDVPGSIKRTNSRISRYFYA